VGLSAAYFRLAFPEAALHCFEPDVLAYDCLVRNATVIGNCTTYRAALYNMACSSRIHFDGSGAGSLAPISGRPARIFLLDAATFMDEMPVAAFDLVKLDAGGVEVPILLRIREKLSRTAVVHVKYYGQLQRRLIDDLLVDSHELWREMTASPTVGRLAYVRR
jgi:FkbM family methyltransferase